MLGTLFDAVSNATTAPGMVPSSAVDPLGAEQNALVQAVTEQVASFKLLPQSFRNLAARVDRLKGMTTVTGNGDLAASLVLAVRALDDAQSRFAVANGTVDAALAAIRRVQEGSGLSFATVGLVVGAANGIRTTQAAAREASSRVQAIEAAVLTPEQRRTAAQLGTQTAFGAMALGGGAMGLAAGAVGLIWLLTRR